MKTIDAKTLFVMFAVAFTGSLFAGAQSVDSLLDKLVEKGVLTIEESQQLKKEVNKELAEGKQPKLKMPDWVKNLKITGDVRNRFEGFYGENEEFIDRNRLRFRVRFGLTASLLENFELGFRLSSSERTDNFGGDPISGNATFADNASKKLVYIDLAYGSWKAINTGNLSLAVSLGKIENPFVLSEMVFDPDYTPEGGALKMKYVMSKEHVFWLNAGCFVLDELSTSSRDPFMVGVQACWNASWGSRFKSTAGAAFMAIANRESLRNDAVPNVNRGNSRTGSSAAAAVPQYGFNPIVVNSGVTYMLGNFPWYKGQFPVELGAEYMVNPAAPHSADNYGYSAMLTFGKAGKKGTWELGYAWKWLGANAWWEEFVDSDFGAYYQNTAAPVNLLDGFVTTTNPTGHGYGAGTNVKGHILRLAYSPTDYFTLGAKLFLTKLINPAPAWSESAMTRLQVDATLKF